MLTIPEMAKLMGIIQNTISDLIRTGLIPVLKFERVRKASVSPLTPFCRMQKGRISMRWRGEVKQMKKPIWQRGEHRH